MDKIYIKYTGLKFRNQLKTGILFLCILFTFCSNADAQRIRYVCTEGSGKQDGSSWENASSDLHKMINLSAPGDQVWVCGNINSPTIYTKVVNRDRKSGVKGYIMKMCTYKDQDPSSYFFMDPHRPLRIPQYSFHTLPTKTKANPPLFLVMQIV